MLGSKVASTGRMVPYDFGFDVKLSHNKDLALFMKRLEEVRNWHSDTDIQGTYKSPTLTIVQSSGTGKTRIMTEAKKQLKQENVACRNILLASESSKEEHLMMNSKGLNDENSGAFDRLYRVSQESNNKNRLKDLRNDFRGMVYEECEEAVKDLGVSESDVGEIEVVLFFDEAQHLAQYDGYLLRVLRWILCEIPNQRSKELQRYRVTAVLSGTSTSLTNFFPDSDPPSSGTRFLVGVAGYYNIEGKAQFDPFFCFRTMGCLAHNPDFTTTYKEDGIADGSEPSEYEQMIRYGRPLFAAMHKQNKLNEAAISDIAEKVILGERSFPPGSCLSVLGTRVQMGSTSAEVVSNLVSKGYAHLTSFRQSSDEEGIPTRATFAFLPDPVCARISMALMDEDIEFKRHDDSTRGLPIRGRSPKFWSAKMGELFSNGICQPNQGDFGEVATALFLLFCGDNLRKAKQDEYKTFSVNLGEWLHEMQTCCATDEAAGTSSSNDQGVNMAIGDSKWSVNFIQFFRYTLRPPLSEFGSRFLLKGLFDKACAIYTPTNQKAVDLIIPCKTGDDYIPIFVSVKNVSDMNPSKARNAMSDSIGKVHSNGVQSGLLLLCLVGKDAAKVDRSAYQNVLGHDSTTNLTALNLTESVLGSVSSEIADMDKKIVPKVLIIHDDVFCIHNAIVSSRAQKMFQTGEVLALHHVLLHRGGTKWLEGRDQEVLPSIYRKAAKDFYGETLGCIDTEL